MKNKQVNQLIKEAGLVYKKHFQMETCFERAIFFSWYCGIADCKYCYMSTQREKIEANNGKGKMARRTAASIIAEAILCKKLGWEIGFISGGHKAHDDEGFLQLLKNLNAATGEKFWLNIGPLSRREMEMFLPYTKGYVASIETINSEVHKFVCPSKPIEPFEKSLKIAGELGIKKAMTIILGLGETIDDFELLKDFINRHEIDKIHFYSLNPQKGTVFENSKHINKEYHAEWIAKTRIAFPKIDIQCGIWLDKLDSVELLLAAGANSISKFPAIRYFNSEYSKKLERYAEKSGRKFNGTLTKLPSLASFNCCLNYSSDGRGTLSSEPDKKLMAELMADVEKKLSQYHKQMSRHKLSGH